MRFFSFDCISNREEAHTREESIKLFKKANRTIKIVAGDPNSEFYNNDDVIAALEEAVKREVEVEIAYYPIQHSSSNIMGASFSIPNIKVWTLKKAPPRHLTIIDGKHIRIERRHRRGAAKTPAIICKNASLLAGDADSKFDALVAMK